MKGSRLGDTFLSISRTFAFYPFFVIGYYYKKNGMKEIEKKKILLIVAALCTMVHSIGVFVKLKELDSTVYQFNSVFETTGDIFLRYYFLIISFWVLILFLYLIPNRRLAVVTDLGKNTLYAFLGHVFILYAMYFLLREVGVQARGLYGFTICVVETAIIGLVFSNVNVKLQKAKKNNKI